MATSMTGVYVSRSRWVYLFWGIISVIFGIVVLSLELDWIRGSEEGVTASYLVALLIGAYLVAWGVLEFFGAVLDWRPHSLLYAIGGILAVAAGVLAWSWPDATYNVLILILAWALILWGVLDIISGFAMHRERHWWVYLLRGLALIVVGILAAAWVNIALFFILLMLGLACIIEGIGSIVLAFTMHGARTAVVVTSSSAPAKKAPARKTTKR
jgi:uncharacterized membrane protein HdeD (DUF308 family)